MLLKKVNWFHEEKNTFWKYTYVFIYLELANSDNVCIICREEMQAPSTKKLPCGHIFHKNCLRSWFQVTITKEGVKIKSHFSLISNCQEYLIDFFLFSELNNWVNQSRNRIFYSYSILIFFSDFCALWCNRLWKISPKKLNILPF